MFDKFLAIGSGFDWISPLWAFCQDAHYGLPFQINVPYDIGWSGKEITKSLNEKGIRTWGLLVVGETITFTVRQPQARYTLYWLERWGITYQANLNGLLNTQEEDKEIYEDKDNDEIDYAEDEDESDIIIPQPVYYGYWEEREQGSLSSSHLDQLVDDPLNKVGNTARKFWDALDD